MFEKLTEATIIASATPVYIIVIGAEMLFSWFHGKHLYSTKGVFSNFILMGLNMVIDLVMRGACLLILSWFYCHRLFEISNGVLYWIVLLFALDFFYYLLHLADHHCRLFWAVHVTHHSSEEFNLTVGFRSSVFQPLYRFIFFIPLAFAGFNALDILFMYAASQVYGILLHTQTIGKLGWLEYILVTPSHHRVHHGCNPGYIDRNMGMLFIIWDRMFGTFQEENEPVQYGITKKINDSNPVEVLFHEWSALVKDVKSAKTPGDIFRYLFKKPGWQPGSEQENSQCQPVKVSSLSSSPSKTA